MTKRMVGVVMFVLLIIALLIPAIRERGSAVVLEMIVTVGIGLVLVGWIITSIYLMCGCGDD